MADITAEATITQEWTEITAALSLADDTRYQVDVEADSGAILYSADTDVADEEPSVGIKGHPIYPPNRDRGADTRSYTKRAGVFSWVRVSRGTATMTFTKVE